MKVLLSLASLGTTLLLSGPVIAAEPAPPDGSAALTAEELAAQLKGNTYSHAMAGGTRDRRISFQGDVAYAMWPGHSGRGRDNSGKWHTRGSSFCISFPQEEECHEVRRSGNELYARFKDGWNKLKKE